MGELKEIPISKVPVEGYDGAELNPTSGEDGRAGGVYSSDKKSSAPGPAENPPVGKPGGDGATVQRKYPPA